MGRGAQIRPKDKEARARHAWKLRQEGLSYETIGIRLGITAHGAHIASQRGQKLKEEAR